MYPYFNLLIKNYLTMFRVGQYCPFQAVCFEFAQHTLLSIIILSRPKATMSTIEHTIWDCCSC